MNAVEAIEQRISRINAELSEHEVNRDKVTSRARATIADVNAALAPLDEELRRGLDPDTRRAGEVREQRRALFARRSEAEQSVRQWERTHGEGAERLRRSRNELRAELQQAQFDAVTDAELERDEKRARFALKAARDDLRIAHESVDHYRAKLAEAHDLVDAEADAVHALAELTGEREALQGDAFIADKPVDAAKLADLDKRITQADKALEQAKQQAGGARAAIEGLEAKIEEQQGNAAEAVERVTAAEAGVCAAVRNRAIRQLAKLVDGMREPLLMLEAADPKAGVWLCKALTERGLHEIKVDGEIVRPAWLHSVMYRPPEYAEALKATAAQMVAADALVTESL